MLILWEPVVSHSIMMLNSWKLHALLNNSLKCAVEHTILGRPSPRWWLAASSQPQSLFLRSRQKHPNLSDSTCSKQLWTYFGKGVQQDGASEWMCFWLAEYRIIKGLVNGARGFSLSPRVSLNTWYYYLKAWKLRNNPEKYIVTIKNLSQEEERSM